MKRDKLLLKKILKWVEANGEYNGTFKLVHGVLGYEDNAVQYHVELLYQAGHLTGQRTQGGVLVQCLTWTGHDMLDQLQTELC